MDVKTRDLPVFPLSPDPVRPEVGRDVAPVRHAVQAIGPQGGLHIGLVTLGCDKNTVDSEHVMAALLGEGARISGEITDADVVIVNTCGFIEAAKEESIETILEACRLKEEGRLRAVVAVGCMVQRYKEELAQEIPEVDLFLGLQELRDLIPRLKEMALLPELEEPVPLMERPLRVLTSDTPHTSYLKISEGCDHTCAFCAIPLMRGLHRSHPVGELVREARGLGEAGVKEINVVSQDTTWYGRDLKRRAAGGEAPLLPDLLQTLLEETDVPWYRLFYMYPSGITRELVDLMARKERILPYLDMPIQHGSDRILTAMRRPERRSSIRERVGWLREAIPDLTLRTTLIVGFPGETEDDFCEMLDFLEEIRFERVGAFTYSVEGGTRAAELDGHLSMGVKNERLERLMDLQRGISLDENLERIGGIETLLVDELTPEDPDYIGVGRTASQAIDVDGAVHLLDDESAGPEDMKLRDVKPGDFIQVEIVDAMEHDLVGKWVVT